MAKKSAFDGHGLTGCGASTGHKNIHLYIRTNTKCIHTLRSLLKSADKELISVVITGLKLFPDFKLPN